MNSFKHNYNMFGVWICGRAQSASVTTDCMFANIWGRPVSKLTVWSVYWEMTSHLPATGTHRQTDRDHYYRESFPWIIYEGQIKFITVVLNMICQCHDTALVQTVYSLNKQNKNSLKKFFPIKRISLSAVYNAG